MSRTRTKKSPAYRVLQQRNANQTEYIRTMAREYQGRYANLSAEAVAYARKRDDVEYRERQVETRSAWGFWRRLRFAVTGR